MIDQTGKALRPLEGPLVLSGGDSTGQSTVSQPLDGVLFFPENLAESANGLDDLVTVSQKAMRLAAALLARGYAVGAVPGDAVRAVAQERVPEAAIRAALNLLATQPDEAAASVVERALGMEAAVARLEPTRSQIPHTLFADLSAHHAKQCCTTVSTLALEAGIPPALARVHLERLRELGKLVRIDIPRLMERDTAFASRMVPNAKARHHFQNGLSRDLYVFLNIDAARSSDTVRSLIGPIIRELSFMLYFRYRLVGFLDRYRTNKIAQWGLQAFCSATEGSRFANHPLAALRSMGAFQSSTRSYLEQVATGGIPFDAYEIGRGTGSRIAMSFALATMPEIPWTLADLHMAATAEVDCLFDHLSGLERNGLDVAQEYRTSPFRNMLAGISLKRRRAERPVNVARSWIEWAVTQEPLPESFYVDAIINTTTRDEAGVQEASACAKAIGLSPKICRYLESRLPVRSSMDDDSIVYADTF